MDIVSIALCGNSATDEIVRTAFERHYLGSKWSLISHEVVRHQKSKKYEWSGHGMLMRTEKRARKILTSFPSTVIGIAIEHGTFKSAGIVDMTDLDILRTDRSEEERQEFEKKLRARVRESKERGPTYRTETIGSVADTHGMIFNCSWDDDLPESCDGVFSWDDGHYGCSGFDIDVVDVSLRIPHHTQFVRALRDAIVAYHTVMKTVRSNPN